MVVNLEYSFNPLQKLLEKGVGSLAEKLRNRAKKIRMGTILINLAHAQTKCLSAQPVSLERYPPLGDMLGRNSIV